MIIPWYNTSNTSERKISCQHVTRHANSLFLLFKFQFNLCLFFATPHSALRRPERTTGSPEPRCQANCASNGQAQEFFAGALTNHSVSTPRKIQRREKFCESSRRNPAEQPLRAFFGYFLPPRAKSIIARKRKGSRLYFALNINNNPQ